MGNPSKEEILESRDKRGTMSGRFLTNETGMTYAMEDEDHTIGNILRVILSKDPNVDFAAYPMPHPTKNELNFRLQTHGKNVHRVMHDAYQKVQDLCETLDELVDEAILKYDAVNGTQGSIQE